MKGLIHIYTGDGKGKSTAAVGLTVRCAGYGENVTFTQFLKNDRSSELKILDSIENIHMIHAQKTFGFVWNMDEDEKAEAKITYTQLLKEAVEDAKANESRLLVLDEIIATYNHGLLDKEFLLAFLKSKPESLEVVMTGRDPQEKLVDLADYVSNIQKVKHPFDQGIAARMGIEK